MGKILSVFQNRYLKLCDDTKEKSRTKKQAAEDEVICMSQAQSNTVSALVSSIKVISNEHSHECRTYLSNRYPTF